MRGFWLFATGLGGLCATMAGPGSAQDSITPKPPLSAKVAWSKTLAPPPAYVADALVWTDSLVVTDRGESALRLYGADGAIRAEMAGAHRKEGGLVGSVMLAADGDRLFAFSRRHALIALSLPSLKDLREEPSNLPGCCGRILAFDSRFIMIGAAGSVHEGPLDYVWSERQDQAPGGRRALWTLDESVRKFMELVYAPLACRAPAGLVAAIRPDHLQMALIDSATGSKQMYQLPQPPGYRPRLRPMPPLVPTQRDEYLAWRAEASYLGGLTCSERGVSLLRGEGVGSATDWFADLYGYDGKLQASVRLPLQATRVIPLNSSCSACVELLAIEGDQMERGTRHTWVRYETGVPR